ncbi:MAG: cytochrome P450 [Thermoleophilia bacterium]|nr:cytochrome P450 [Thermoleophilia bacterium]
MDPATAAVLETLRLAQSEYVYRSVEEPIGVDGFVIPAGWLLRICVAESHLLDPHFVDPLRFDPGRHVRSRTARSEFSPFGLDAHSCLGARLTLELGRSLVEAFADYVPTVEASERPSRGNRHWRHWGVGPDFRLLLTPRE